MGMGRVGRPFEGRRREEARRQRRIDRARAGKREQERFTISVEKYSLEWSLIEPQRNRSEYIRKCVRMYPALSRTVQELKAVIAVLEADKELQRSLKREAQDEVFRLREILESHSIMEAVE
jgi:hypothetical protein